MRSPLGLALASALAWCGCGSSSPLGTHSLPLNAGLRSQHRPVCSGGRFHCKSLIRVMPAGPVVDAPTAGLGPPDLQSAYALDPTRSGPTIAIVDAFGYPNAESDLATYRSQYGLPPCSVASGCLTIVNQDGGTSPLPPAPTAQDDWTVETALDLDMASAGCPKCKLLLVQADDDQGDGLNYAQQTAVNLGAQVISNSWGGDDQADAGLSSESYFDHPGVGEFVAAGDNGYDNGDGNPDYPSTSQYVTAVGGTNLSQTGGTGRGWTETAWTSGGSSCSLDIPQPSFQANLSTSCNFRAASDVAAVGDPNTGVAVYNNGPSSTGWTVVGGTSAASPLVAAIYSLVGRPAAGPSLSYTHTSAFWDVTQGSNGSCGNVLCNAGTGWDGPTGNGTPNGAALICAPQCGGKQCGDDGCGGSCGSCGTGVCGSTGQCFDFSLAISPSTLQVSQAGSATATVSTTVVTGAASPVDLSLAGLPTGVTGIFQPTTVNAGQTATLTIAATNAAALGSTPFTITGLSGAASHQVQGTVNVVTGPAVSFASPLDGSTVSNVVAVQVQVTNASASAQIAVTVDGQSLATGQGTSLSQNWDTSLVTNGPHTLAATVSDGAKTGSAQVSVTVFNPLTVAVTSPDAGSTLSGKSAAITATAKLNGVALASIEIDMDDFPIATGSANPFTATVDTTQLGDGTHVVSAKATDANGDVAVAPAIPLNINNPLPKPPPPDTPDAGTGGGSNGSGCGCVASAGSQSAWSVVLLILLVGLLPRRRRS